MKLLCKMDETTQLDDGSLVEKLLEALVSCKPRMHGVKLHVHPLLAYWTERRWVEEDKSGVEGGALCFLTHSQIVLSFLLSHQKKEMKVGMKPEFPHLTEMPPEWPTLSMP